MTECERIIKNGFLPESFFEEEVRCDFMVTKERKKIWAIELDLLRELDRVCKKYNLVYVLYCGSLLGAVRHKGFIPWDDDIDVAMPRNDYEKLMAIGDEEFSIPYFLQSHENEKDYFYSFAKVRNSNTSAISYNFRYQKFNQGGFLDIFPFDNCLLDDLCSRSQSINEKILDLSTYMRMSNPYLLDADKERVKRYSGKDPNETIKEIMEEAKVYSDIDTEYVAPYCFTLYDIKKQVFKKTDLFETVLVDFENLKVPIPRNYDMILQKLYGDYMEFPPMEKRVCEQHTGSVFDMDIPYKERLQIMYYNDAK